MNDALFENGQYKIKEDLRRRCGNDSRLFHHVIADFHLWVTLAAAYRENYVQYQKIVTNDVKGMRTRDALSYGFGLTLLTLFSFLFRSVGFRVGFNSLSISPLAKSNHG